MSNRPPDYEATANDYGRTLTATLTDSNRDPVNLSSATAIQMRLGKPGLAPIATGAASKAPDQDADTGVITYTWTSDQLTQPGDFEMTFVVTFPDARLTFPTEPLIVRIKRELAAMT